MYLNLQLLSVSGQYLGLSIQTDILSLYNDIKIESINDCYYNFNANKDEDSHLTRSIIDNHCSSSNIYISQDLRYTALRISNSKSITSDLLNIILKNDYINYSKWEWHEAGIPVLRTRYVELVEHERSLFIPLAFLIAALTLIWVFRQFKTLVIALISII